jgi:quercetin dioxygenase-like cupin family protein
MKRGILFVGLVAVIATLAFSASAGSRASADAMAAHPAPTIVLPSAVKWGPVKGMAGLEYAVLYGDPTKALTEYAARYKMPAGFKFPPHSHPMWEEVTVLSGTFLVGLGDKYDASKMTALPAGSYVAIPPQVTHYAMAKTETILEVHGLGPDKMNMVK